MLSYNRALCVFRCWRASKTACTMRMLTFAAWQSCRKLQSTASQKCCCVLVWVRTPVCPSVCPGPLVCQAGERLRKGSTHTHSTNVQGSGASASQAVSLAPSNNSNGQLAKAGSGDGTETKHLAQSGSRSLKHIHFHARLLVQLWLVWSTADPGDGINAQTWGPVGRPGTSGSREASSRTMGEAVTLFKGTVLLVKCTSVTVYGGFSCSDTRSSKCLSGKNVFKSHWCEMCDSHRFHTRPL